MKFGLVPIKGEECLERSQKDCTNGITPIVKIISWFVVFSIQTVSTAQELRKPVYRTVAARSIDYDKLLALMANVKWDIRDIMSQHSHYVDVLLQVGPGLEAK